MKIDAGTIARTATLALALINQLLAVFGCEIIDVGSETINELVSAGFTIAASVYAWWKNNSFTKSAIKADAYMRALKTGADK